MSGSLDGEGCLEWTWGLFAALGGLGGRWPIPVDVWSGSHRCLL